jgi:MFS transporter, ACS family, glucarate transporter
MNTGANVGGSLSPVLAPWLAGKIVWAGALGAAALVAFIGGLMWIKISPGGGLRSGHEVGTVSP